MEREYADLEEIWKAEKATLHGTQSIKSSLEKARNDIESARRGGDLARMSEIQYGVIPSLERKLEMAAEAEIAEKQLLRNRVTEQEIADVVSRSTGIPISKMLQGDKQRLLDMESFLQRRVIGQKEALTAVSNAVRRSRSGLSDPNRPNGVFLFLGPTGVGKTELCKTLAEFLFDSQDAMLRIDMSEFMEQHSVARLIGAPPGYVGYEEGGYLTEGVRRRPYSLLLLDEVEKAHPDVFNILLQVMDDGRLTDGHGRTVDFRNTIIVMTSKLGSDRIQEMLNQPAIDAARYNSVKKIVMGSVVEHFSPEFVNRIDETVVFHPLQESQIREIAEIQINLLRHRLAQTGVGIQVNNEVLDHIAKIAYDPVYGARQLKRTIQNWIENPLAQEVLKGAYFPGDTIIIDLAADNELRLSKAAPELDKEVA